MDTASVLIDMIPTTPAQVNFDKQLPIYAFPFFISATAGRVTSYIQLSVCHFAISLFTDSGKRLVFNEMRFFKQNLKLACTSWDSLPIIASYSIAVVTFCRQSQTAPVKTYIVLKCTRIAYLSLAVYPMANTLDSTGNMC